VKLSRITSNLGLLVLCAVLAGCNGSPRSAAVHLVVYIDGDCRMETWDGGEIDELVAFPGDVIVFVNKSSSDKEIDFTNEGRSPFDSMSYTIEPSHRLKVKVQSGARGAFDFNFNCTSPTGGGPKVSIGDPP